MPLPPDEDPLRPLLDQLANALEESGIDDPAAQAGVLEGLRTALELVGQERDGELPVPASVTLIRPGLPPEGRPHLRLATDADGDEPDDEPSPRVRVLHRSVLGPRLGQGSIRLAASGGGPRRQTVYAGESTRIYRLLCLSGQFKVLVDDAPVDRLEQGQSLDVEGRRIRVQAVGGEGALGQYQPVELL
jgi:hypothetical protein